MEVTHVISRVISWASGADFSYYTVLKIDCTQNRDYLYISSHEFRQLDEKLLTETNTVKNVDFVHLPKWFSL